LERGGEVVSGLFHRCRFYGKVFASNRFAGTISMPALARKYRPEPEPEPSRKSSPRPSPKPEHKSERQPAPLSGQPRRRRKVFHAAVLVTRLEESFVEANSAEEARALFASGEGHRAASGERAHVEIERLLEDGE
jgi:hypothetical protein